jgi:hypothetical protein
MAENPAEIEVKDMGTKTVKGTRAIRLREMAMNGTLPVGFEAWDTVLGPEDMGRTVAHMAASSGHLPSGFDRWEIADHSGWTVAHCAAAMHALPEGFGMWDLADDEGWTVAHVAAKHGSLPEGFDRWDIVKFDRWLPDAKDGWTVAHEAVKWGNLPEGFDRWNLADGNGWTVAHEAAFSGTLPAAFDRWELKDGTGWSVANVAAYLGDLPENVPDGALRFGQSADVHKPLAKPVPDGKPEGDPCIFSEGFLERLDELVTMLHLADDGAKGPGCKSGRAPCPAEVLLETAFGNEARDEDDDNAPTP